MAPSAARRKRSRMVRPDDQIGDPGLVLDRDEDHAVGAARTLADQYHPGDRQPPVDRQMGEIGGGDQTLASELGAKKGERVALQGQAEAGIILDDMLAQRHLGQQRHGPHLGGHSLTRFAALSTLSRIAGEGGPGPTGWVGEGLHSREERQRRLAERLQRP